jgi:hypothetical protein
MLRLFEDDQWDSFAHRALSAILYGGADFAECTMTIDRIGNSGDPGPFDLATASTGFLTLLGVPAEEFPDFLSSHRGFWR